MKYYKPWLLQCELTNDCVGNCSYCMRKHIPFEIEEMDWEFFKWLVDITTPYISEVRLSGVGEPLLCDWLEQAIRYAKRYKKRTSFYTNAVLLDHDRALSILDAGLDEIRFSVDECDPVRFRQAQGISFKNIYENIAWFRHLRDEAGYETKITIRTTHFADNWYRIKEIKEFWEPYCDVHSVVPVRHMEMPETLEKTPYMPGRGGRCLWSEEHMTIKANGALVLCIEDYYRTYTMAELKEYGMNPLFVYNGRIFSQIREKMHTGEYIPRLCLWCPQFERW